VNQLQQHQSNNDEETNLTALCSREGSTHPLTSLPAVFNWSRTEGITPCLLT